MALTKAQLNIQRGVPWLIVGGLIPSTENKQVNNT